MSPVLNNTGRTEKNFFNMTTVIWFPKYLLGVETLARKSIASLLRSEKSEAYMEMDKVSSTCSEHFASAAWK